MISTDPLDASDLDAIAALCGRSMADAPRTSGARGNAVRGRPAGSGARGPDDRRRRAGRMRRRTARAAAGGRPSGAPARATGGRCSWRGEEWARRRVTRSSSSAPTRRISCGRVLPITETALLCLLESCHYGRVEANFDMDIDLSAIPDDPGGHRLARAEERHEIDEWMARPLAELAARGAPRHSRRGTWWWLAKKERRRADRVLRVRGQPGGPARARVAVRPGPDGSWPRSWRSRRRARTSWLAAEATGSRSVGSDRSSPMRRSAARVSDVYFVYRKELP